MTTTVTFRGRNAYPVNVQVGLAGEYNVSRVYFEPPATGVYNLYITFADGSVDVFDVTNDGLWVIDTDVTRHPGKATAYLQVTDGEVALWKSKDFNVMIEAAGDIDDDLEKQYPSAMTQALVQVHEDMVAADQSAKDAKDEADRAHGEAERAKDEADRADGEADRAEGEADRADGEANRAEDEANRAEREANRAEDAAGDAATQAGYAKDYAEQAQAKLDDIDTAVNDGKQALQDKANELVSQDGTIGQALWSVQLVANNAAQYEGLAMQDANEARRQADSALTWAMQARTDRNDARTAAGQATAAVQTVTDRVPEVLQSISDAGDEAVAEVERVKATIPADYTVLEGDVTQLKSDYANHETRIDALENAGGSGAGLPAEVKAMWANSIKNEIAYTSTTHPYTDALLAFLESGDTPIVPPDDNPDEPITPDDPDDPVVPDDPIDEAGVVYSQGTPWNENETGYVTATISGINIAGLQRMTVTADNGLLITPQTTYAYLPESGSVSFTPSNASNVESFYLRGRDNSDISISNLIVLVKNSDGSDIVPRTGMISISMQEPNDDGYESGYIDNTGNLTAKSDSYVSTRYADVTPASKVRISNIIGTSTIRVAQYDADKIFVKRGYATDGVFTLEATTKYIRVGFDASAPQNIRNMLDYYIIEVI